MRTEIVAIGTELLLGQIVDTNSAWIGQQLAINGIDCLYQTRVGDNRERIVNALNTALERSDAVITCGGLGPTQDDITREAIAQVMGVPLVRDAEAERRVIEIFTSRKREMSSNNLRQADLPLGARTIDQVLGTAPGLICPVGTKVIYALPGVPPEMREMLERAVLPDLRTRAGEASTILSRTLRTYGLSESKIAEMVAPRLDALDVRGPGAPTIAFLASGIEGVKVRITVKADDVEQANALLEVEERELRLILGASVFGIDEENMEHALGSILLDRGLSLSVAESFTGGLISSRLVAIPGASRWFRGGIVAYSSEVKFDLLGVDVGPVVTEKVACAMAEGARRQFGSDTAVATTGVAGPDSQEGLAPGICFLGIALPGAPAEALALSLTGGRQRIRELATLQALGALRERLLA